MGSIIEAPKKIHTIQAQGFPFYVHANIGVICCARAHLIVGCNSILRLMPTNHFSHNLHSCKSTPEVPWEFLSWDSIHLPSGCWFVGPCRLKPRTLVITPGKSLNICLSVSPILANEGSVQLS